MCGACIESQFIISSSAREQITLDTRTSLSRLSSEVHCFEITAFMMETPQIQRVLDLWRHDPVVALCRLMEGSIDELELNVPEDLLVEAHKILHAPAVSNAAEAWGVLLLIQPLVRWLSGEASIPITLSKARRLLATYSEQWLWDPEKLTDPDTSTASAAGGFTSFDSTSLEQPDDPIVAIRSAQVDALFPALYLAFCLLRQSASNHRELFLPIAFGIGWREPAFHGLDLWLRRQALVVVLQQWKAAAWERREFMDAELIAYCADRLAWADKEKSTWLST